MSLGWELGLHAGRMVIAVGLAARIDTSRILLLFRPVMLCSLSHRGLGLTLHVESCDLSECRLERLQRSVSLAARRQAPIVIYLEMSKNKDVQKSGKDKFDGTLFHATLKCDCTDIVGLQNTAVNCNNSNVRSQQK